MAEMEGFEPPHVLRRLADFESAPFSRLGTSPKTGLLYQRKGKKSRVFPGRLLLFCQFQDPLHSGADGIVVLTAVGTEAIGAVLDAVFSVSKAAAALFSQGVKGAIAEDTAESIRICSRVAGEIFTFPILKKIVMTHN